MKLIDVLVQDLPKQGGWPAGVQKIETHDDGMTYYDDSYVGRELYPNVTDGWTSSDGSPFHIMENGQWWENTVTREQYEAALSAKKQCEHNWVPSEGRTASGWLCRDCGDYNGPDAKVEADNDGWIEWHGGQCPVPFGTKVDVKFRNGKVYQNKQAWGSVDVGKGVDSVSEAGSAFWRKDNSDRDIVAYRICTGSEQPSFELEDFTYFSNVRGLQTHVNVYICQGDLFFEDNIQLVTCLRDENLGGVRFTPEQALEFALDLAATAAKMMSKE